LRIEEKDKWMQMSEGMEKPTINYQSPDFFALFFS
jgi:hypothetical protein